jgi:hypothetical protein
MPTVNHYFNNYDNSMEQTLVEDLVIESIKIYGIECFYMPRTLINEDDLFGEDTLSSFDNAYPIEMYIKNVDGFEGDGDFLSKFGLEIRDEMTLTVAQRRFDEEVHISELAKFAGRPVEGDLIFLPLNGKVYEIKFVEHESIFYQMGSLQTYDLRCELFEYSHETIDTGINVIDTIEDTYSADKGFYQLIDESGNVYVHEDGSSIVMENYNIGTTDTQAQNTYFEKQTSVTSDSGTNFIDWSESNPFGDV